MALSKIVLKPGINRDQTNYASEGGWYECDKIRFRSGFPEKIGGWEKYSTQRFIGICRSLFNWVTTDGNNILSIGTHKKVYVEAGTLLFDVTPLRSVVVITPPSILNVLSTVSGTRRILVSLTAHGALTGDYVQISNVTGIIGGIPASEINGPKEVLNASVNTFEIEVASLATSDAFYQAPITLEFDIHAGQRFGAFGYGWGAGAWSRESWGSPALTPVSTNPRLYTQDRFNNNLLFCIRNADIYVWLYSSNFTNRAIGLLNYPGASAVPQIVGSILVSQQDRHLLAFGCTAFGTGQYDPLLIRWASQDAPEWWTPGNVIVPSTGRLSSAGFLRVSNGSEIVRAIRTRDEILVYTDSSLYSLRYLGSSDVFGLVEMADNISIISPSALTTVNNVTFWMGADKFYIYNGRVDTLPCTLRQYIFSDINRSSQFQIVCGTSEQFNEIIWFYPSGNSQELDRYVIYNYVEQIWYYGQLERTAWLDSPLRTYPQGVDSTGWVYDQEKGVDADGLPLTSYIVSGDVDIEDGEQFMLVRRIIPDINFNGSTSTNPQVKLTVNAHNFPGQVYRTNNLENTGLTKTVTGQKDPVTAIIDQYTNQVFIRTRGRQIKYTISSDGLGVQWQMGMPRIDASPDGKRG